MMRKLILYIAQSIDGFIAKKDGNLDWLTEDEKPDGDVNKYGYLDLLESVDTTLMGYKTYNEVLNFDIPFPYPNKKNYVFSRSHKKNDDNPVEFVASNIAEFVRELKTFPGKDIWLIGGGEINKLLLNANLIDEMIISIKPVVLGDGIPLFASGSELKRFMFQSSKWFDNGLVQLVMQKL